LKEALGTNTGLKASKKEKWNQS